MSAPLFFFGAFDTAYRPRTSPFRSRSTTCHATTAWVRRWLRGSVSAKAIGALPIAEGQAQPPYRLDTMADDGPEPPVPLADGAGDR